MKKSTPHKPFDYHIGKYYPAVNWINYDHQWRTFGSAKNFNEVIQGICNELNRLKTSYEKIVITNKKYPKIAILTFFNATEVHCFYICEAGNNLEYRYDIIREVLGHED